MALKYEHEVESPERTAPVESPLYGPGYVPPQRPKMREQLSIDLKVLSQVEILDALKAAEAVYYQELVRHGYSPLTVGSYSSSVGRFIQFLEMGRVIPDREQ